MREVSVVENTSTSLVPSAVHITTKSKVFQDFNSLTFLGMEIVDSVFIYLEIILSWLIAQALVTADEQKNKPY